MEGDNEGATKHPFSQHLLLRWLVLASSSSSKSSAFLFPLLVFALVLEAPASLFALVRVGSSSSSHWFLFALVLIHRIWKLLHLSSSSAPGCSRDGVVSVEAQIKKLRWDGIELFLDSERKVWKIDGVLAGYVQKWGGLTNVVVLDAGHFVPTDLPVHSQAMVEDWVLEKELFASGA